MCEEALDKRLWGKWEKPPVCNCNSVTALCSSRGGGKGEKAVGEVSGAARARREWLHLRAAAATSTPVWKSKLARWSRRLFLWCRRWVVGFPSLLYFYTAAREANFWSPCLPARFRLPRFPFTASPRAWTTRSNVTCCFRVVANITTRCWVGLLQVLLRLQGVDHQSLTVRGDAGCTRREARGLSCC